MSAKHATGAVDVRIERLLNAHSRTGTVVSQHGSGRRAHRSRSFSRRLSRHKFRNFAHAIPAGPAGKTVLDIGCNAGFYSLEMKRRGAERVLGIDFDDDYLAQARFAAEVAGARDIEFRKMSVYDVAESEREVRLGDLHGRAVSPAASAAGARSDS